MAKVYVYRFVSRSSEGLFPKLYLEQLDADQAKAMRLELIGTMDVDPIPDPVPDGSTT